MERRYFWQGFYGVMLAVSLLVGCLLAMPAHAITFPEPPFKGYFYVDEAKVMTISQRSVINNVSKSLMHDKKIPLIVVTIPSLVAKVADTITIEHYAKLLFDTWRIGIDGANYGIIILVSRDDKMANIQLGNGWTGNYRERVKKVLSSVVMPSVKEGNYATGIVMGTRNIDAMVRDISLSEESKYAKSTLNDISNISSWSTKWLWLAILAVVIAIGHSIYTQGREGWGWMVITVLGNLFRHLLHFITGGRFGKSGE